MRESSTAQKGCVSQPCYLESPAGPPVSKGRFLSPHGLSRAGVLSLREEAYAHGRVVLGKRPSELGASVGIWESGWCAWLGAVAFANFNVKWVILQSPCYVSLVRRRLPQATILVLDEKEVDWCKLSDVSMIFCDRAPGAACSVWKFPSLMDLVAYREARRHPPLQDFVLTKLFIKHDQVGGVSDFCGKISHYHRTHIASVQVTLLLGSPVKTVLDCTIDATWNQPRREITWEPVPCAPLRRLPVSGMGTTFSSEGLYPLAGHLRHPPQFMAPCVFSSSGFVRRRLAAAELLKVLDVAPLDAAQLSPARQLNLWLERPLPGKISQSFVIALLDRDRKELGPSPAKVHRVASPFTICAQSLSTPQAPLAPFTSAEGVFDEGQKAAKNDNAAVPVGFWDTKFATSWKDIYGVSAPVGWRAALAVIRQGAHSAYRRRMLLDFWRWESLRAEAETVALCSLRTTFVKGVGVRRRPSGWRTNIRRLVLHTPRGYAFAPGGLLMYVKQLGSILKGHRPDIVAGREVVRVAAGSTWWEWPLGSRLVFWRWDPPVQLWARDGHPGWLTSPPHSWRMRQPPERDASTRTKVCTKLLDVLAKGYFERGLVTNLMPFFSVPKGTHDVRLVYDGSKSGLNSYL